MAKLLNDERETHINMVHGSNKMKIYTTEYNIMKKLDRYVENNENWKIVEVGMVHGEVVSKTYEAPKDLLLIREKKRVLTEQQRADAAARLKAYHAAKHADDDEMDVIDFGADDSDPDEDNEEEIIKENSHVLDLVLPVVVLIASCIVAMIYTGGFFTGASFVDAFANSSASVGLVLGGSVTLAFTFVYYMLRDVLSFREFTECIPDGFKSMIAPIMILTLAWTLSGVTNLLGAKVFVADMVQHFAQGLQGFLPMVIFVVAAFLAFATGTSWGTFSILIPIVIGVFPSGQMMAISIASCLAGAVCGDHCSPISDTTIMASAGGHCEHVNHVATQLPYVGLVAAVCMIGYFIIGVLQAVGLTQFSLLALPVCIVLLVAILFVIREKTGGKEEI
mgnify:CR=1 FL=1